MGVMDGAMWTSNIWMWKKMETTMFSQYNEVNTMLNCSLSMYILDSSVQE